MKLIEVITKEFVTIVENLILSEPVENGRIVLDREKFKKTLEKYNYMKLKDKTKVYKDLNFILHDKNNYTLPVKDHKLNKTVRKVVINYNTYETVKKLCDLDFN